MVVLSILDTFFKYENLQIASSLFEEGDIYWIYKSGSWYTWRYIFGLHVTIE